MRKIKVVVVENSYALLLCFGQASGTLEIGQNCIFYGIGNGFGLLWIRRISFFCKRFWFTGNRQNFVFLFFWKSFGFARNRENWIIFAKPSGFSKWALLHSFGKDFAFRNWPDNEMNCKLRKYKWIWKCDRRSCPRKRFSGIQRESNPRPLRSRCSALPA